MPMTNTFGAMSIVEGFYSIFKRSVRASISIAPRNTSTAIFQNSTSVTQTAWRLASTGERANLAIKGAAGKRLTYRQAN
jgi:hypothetical protein